ncbi:hypothetical protein [uncultured Brevundimonas sp.]|uniref:hypothetical protein n=1 Tax=uncultured Brevundimonas sp. TaxID=213418 RepID=UPI0030EE39B4|tara:strand:- start:1390 stop:1983 length:594 start_codon:yes stop_codon:yes gene_type:complete
MTRLMSTMAATALLFAAGGAAAAERCGATTHSRFGETRAYFTDVLAACRPDGYCSVVVALPDLSGQAAYTQQLRVARPSAGAERQVEFVAAEPMPSGTGLPMSLTFPGQSIDLTSLVTPTSPGTNEYRVTDPITARSIVAGLRRQRLVRWTYQTESGRPQAAYFTLNGMTAALDWIDCMAAPVRAAEPPRRGPRARA